MATNEGRSSIAAFDAGGLMSIHPKPVASFEIIDPENDQNRSSIKTVTYLMGSLIRENGTVAFARAEYKHTRIIEMTSIRRIEPKILHQLRVAEIPSSLEVCGNIVPIAEIDLNLLKIL